MTRPPIPNSPYAGGCLCGAVRYALKARPLAVNACHCMDCKKLSGATHIVMLIADTAAFSVTGETVLYRKPADSGREVGINRCARCGTRLWHQNMSAPQWVFVAAGTLDDPSWTVPTSHIWTDKASRNVVMEDDAVKVAGQPADRKVLMDCFAAIHGDA